MGKRTQWTDEQLTEAVKATKGNLTAAARYLNHTYKHEKNEKVTRQNLQTWVENRLPEDVKDEVDNNVLNMKNRRLQNTCNSLRRQMKALEQYVGGKEEFLNEIKDAVTNIPSLPNLKVKQANGRGLTIELLFSDLQIGKLMTDYDHKIAQARIEEYVEVSIDRINQYTRLGYRIDKIIFAILGDVIESDKKHGHQSARACDIGTAEQIRLAQEILFHRCIRRLYPFAEEMDVIMITGNHDWDGRGLFMFNPGKEQLSWPLYHAVKQMAIAAGFDDINFFIPEGAFHVHDIYNNKVLYEHGVGVSAGYTAMKNHLAKRTDQLKQYITLFRMGDKHNISRFNNDRLVVNGAFFGDSRNGEEYSGIAGYDGEPAQLLFAHVERNDDLRTTLFDSLAIQLGHIK